MHSGAKAGGTPSTSRLRHRPRVVFAPHCRQATYGGMLSTLPALYRSSGLARLYAGGLARTIRTCGAFFVVSTMRERFIQYRATQSGFRA